MSMSVGLHPSGDAKWPRTHMAQTSFVTVGTAAPRLPAQPVSASSSQFAHRQPGSVSSSGLAWAQAMPIPTAMAAFRPGDAVEARWAESDTWFPATIAQNIGDGTFLVNWLDGSRHGRTKRLADLRLRGSVDRIGPTTAGTTSESSGAYFASGASPEGRANAERTEAATARSEELGSAAPASGVTAGRADATDEEPRAVERAGESGSADGVDEEAPTTPLSDLTADIRNDTGASEALVDNATDGPKPRDDVKCYLVEKADGQKAVVVERSDGKRWRFEQRHIDFELQCDAESLSTWLDTVTTQQMPGLLTLLAGEVTERGGQLKEAEKDRDALRGVEDYEFFGLDGASCSDKDVERAYRKKSTQLHPDKGGNEQSFNAMREKYEQLKSLRNENKRKDGGGGSIKWDPNSRESMLEAHMHLREQLVWITRHISEVQEQLEALRQRQRARHVLTWAGGPT